MRNFLFLALLSFLAISCGDDIVSNTPSIQGEVDGQFFRSASSSAIINPDSTVTMTGTTASQVITLKIAANEVGTYTLGENTQNEATFETADQELYVTGTSGFGEIEVSKIEANKLSGNFYFYARKDGTGDTLNFNKGFFFEVPISNPFPPASNLTCTEANTEVASAQLAYNAADTSNPEEFNSLCLAYKNALLNKIEACGDEDGSVQQLIDDLGDCEVGNQGGDSFTADVDTETKEFINIAGNSISNSITIKGFSPTDAPVSYSIELVMPNDITQGTYTNYSELIESSFVWRYIEDGTGANAISESVELEITAHDITNNHIEGTFMFDADLEGTTKSITNGEFSVDY